MRTCTCAYVRYVFVVLFFVFSFPALTMSIVSVSVTMNLLQVSKGCHVTKNQFGRGGHFSKGEASNKCIVVRAISVKGVSFY